VATMPDAMASEIECGHASVQDVIAALDTCFAYFAALRRAC
jgi:hypothetical protein